MFVHDVSQFTKGFTFELALTFSLESPILVWGPKKIL